MPQEFMISFHPLKTQNVLKHEAMDFSLLVQSCPRPGLVKPLHGVLVIAGLSQDVFYSTRLLNFYAQTDDLPSSREVFGEIPEKNVYSWNSMISGYAKIGSFKEAIDCFSELVSTSTTRPDCATFPPLLKLCEALADGDKIHCWILKLGCERDVYVSASLVHMYSRFGFVHDAKKLFDEMPVRDLGSWNAMLTGCCHNGMKADALGLFAKMQLESFRIDSMTACSILRICALLDDPLVGRSFHTYIIKYELTGNIFVSNALITMYAKFGYLQKAHRVFDNMMNRDLVTWSSMIAACDQNDDPQAALAFFVGMREHGFQFSALTLMSLASIASQLGDTRKGQSIHGLLLRKGWISKQTFVEHVLLDMYAKLHKVDYAKNIFDGMHERDVIAWSTLIRGYAQSDLPSEAIDLYSQMLKCHGILEDEWTLVSVLSAVTQKSDLRLGRIIHGRSVLVGLEVGDYMRGSLIDMYIKCWKLDEALPLFKQTQNKSPILWNVLIFGHRTHGDSKKALLMFEEMRGEGLKPDENTFLLLLSVCNHAVLVEEGKKYFHMMIEEYNIKPDSKHYACMIDLFVRAGQFGIALELTKHALLTWGSSLWHALLSTSEIPVDSQTWQNLLCWTKE